MEYRDVVRCAIVEWIKDEDDPRRWNQDAIDALADRIARANRNNAAPSVYSTKPMRAEVKG